MGWYPRLPEVDLQKEVDDLYRRVFGAADSVKKVLPPVPLTFVVENNGYVLDLDFPGFAKEEVAVEVVKDVVRVTANSVKRGNKSYLVTLPEDAEEEMLTASLENGVLLLKVPRQDQNKNIRRIPL